MSNLPAKGNFLHPQRALPHNGAMPELSLTVPIFNEEENLEKLYEAIRRAMDKLGRSWELIIINDGSTDDSDALLDEIAEKDQRVKVVHFRQNAGQTAAMMAGFDYAQGEVIVPLDGDLQNDPEDIAAMLDAIEAGYDVVSGWRKDRQDSYMQRNLPSIMANRLISKVSGVRLHDFGCSLKAYRRDVIKGVRLYGEMHRFLPIYARWHGAKITEVVVTHMPRRRGKSKYGLERVLKVLLDLLVVRFYDRFAHKPMYLFGGMAFCSMLLSGLFFLFMLYLRFFEGKTFIETPVPLAVVGFFGLGIICFLMGLLAEMVMRTFYESQGKRTYLVRATRNLEPSNRPDTAQYDMAPISSG